MDNGTTFSQLLNENQSKLPCLFPPEVVWCCWLHSGDSNPKVSLQWCQKYGITLARHLWRLNILLRILLLLMSSLLFNHLKLFNLFANLKFPSELDCSGGKLDGPGFLQKPFLWAVEWWTDPGNIGWDHRGDAENLEHIMCQCSIATQTWNLAQVKVGVPINYATIGALLSTAVLLFAGQSSAVVESPKW